jgi:hypothetical protein
MFRSLNLAIALVAAGYQSSGSILLFGFTMYLRTTQFGVHLATRCPETKPDVKSGWLGILSQPHALETNDKSARSRRAGRFVPSIWQLLSISNCDASPVKSSKNLTGARVRRDDNYLLILVEA